MINLIDCFLKSQYPKTLYSEKSDRIDDEHYSEELMNRSDTKLTLRTPALFLASIDHRTWYGISVTLFAVRFQT